MIVQVEPNIGLVRKFKANSTKEAWKDKTEYVKEVTQMKALETEKEIRNTINDMHNKGR